MSARRPTTRLRVAMLLTSSAAGAQRPPSLDRAELPLWPDGAPGSEGKTGPQQVRLRDHGILALVLEYRLAREEGSACAIEQHALWDIQRAIRLVRFNARQLGVDPARIGAIGVSAGGELAARAAMSDLDGDPGASDVVDRRSSRPNFQVLIDPGNSGALTVSKNSPPVFISAGYNDRPDISRGMAELYLKYRRLACRRSCICTPRQGMGSGSARAARVRRRGGRRGSSSG